MNKKNAVAPVNAKPLALPDVVTLKRGAQETDADYVARVGAWYERYFLATFRTFTRADVGIHINPGHYLMRIYVGLLTSGVIFSVPQDNRFWYFTPLKTLLEVIANTWADCAAPALRAIERLSDLQRAFDVDEKEQCPIDEVRQHYNNVQAERKGLKDDLRKLSETLLNATAAHADETIKAINAVGEKVDAARGDIADVGKELFDANDRTQQLIHDRFEGLKPTQAGVDYLVGKKTQRTRNAKKAQAESVDMYAAEKQRAADDMHRALERVRDDPDVKAGKHGAVLTACRRLCDWMDKAGHVHHGRFDPLTTSKKHGEPQYAPLMDWQGKPIKPETLARNYRDSRKKPKTKRGTK